MRSYILLAALLPYFALGGSLQDAILNTLRLNHNQNQEVQQCNICPYTGELILQPNVPRSVAGCCSSNFQECGAGDARCRLLGEYVIPEEEEPSNNVEICPDSQCPCQRQFNMPRNVSLRLCPTPATCCQSCRCIGDPHCTSFNGQTESFVVCDVRDGNCDWPSKQNLARACANVTYNGEQCVVRPDPTGKLFCQIPANLPAPTMNMYNRPYVTPTGETRNFKIDLALSIYGSIQTVTIEDGGNTYSFGLRYWRGKFSCTLPPNLSQIASKPSLQPGGWVRLDKLDSGVEINMQCIILKALWGTRWEVSRLLDDFDPNASGRGGFCQTGNIPESSGEATPCNIDRRLLRQFEQWGYYCKGHSTFTPPPVDTNGTDAGGWSNTYCKQSWCSKPLMSTGTGKNWQAAGFASERQCENYVSVVGDNFLRSVCTVAPGVDVSHPSKCEADATCKDCMDNLKDFPEQAVDILRPATVPRPNTPGSGGGGSGGGRCVRDSLLELGIQNAQEGVAISTGGVKLLYQAPGSTEWVVIWQATDEEIHQYTSACGCVDFLQDNQDILFTAAGTYRVQQCYPEIQFVPSNCYSAPTYNVTARYPVTPFVVDFSRPFGMLVDRRQLVCGPTTQCPPESICCTWPHGGEGWKQCMGDLATQYPNCGKKRGCPGCP